MNVYTSTGALAGIVNDDGFIYDASGSHLGSVDTKGFVFNRENLFVGHVSNATQLPRVGELQPFAIMASASETVLGSVDTEGTIYHIELDGGNQDELPLRKVGSVSPLADFFLAGAAIWLLVEDIIFTLCTGAFPGNVSAERAKTSE